MTHSVRQIRLQSDELTFWVEVRACTEDRRLAVAFLAGDPEIGMGPTEQDAILDALKPLGEAASRLLTESL